MCVTGYPNKGIDTRLGISRSRGKKVVFEEELDHTSNNCLISQEP